MPEHLQYEDDDLFNPETHHEHSDVPVRPLFIFIGIFIVFGFVTWAGVYLLHQAFVKAERGRMDPPQTQVARPADVNVPKNQPLLQPFPRAEVAPYQETPVTDLAQMRNTENHALHTYGWVDKQKGIARIPIDEAKKRLAAQQVAPAATTTTTTGGTQ